MLTAYLSLQGVSLERLVRMNLLDLVDTLVKRTVNCSSNCECTANNGAQTNKETGEGLCAHFAVDDLHW